MEFGYTIQMSAQSQFLKIETGLEELWEKSRTIMPLRIMDCLGNIVNGLLNEGLM